MFKSLSKIIFSKFSKKSDLSHQLEIVKVFDLYREQLRDLPGGAPSPVSLKDQVLVVQVDSSVQASELRLREAMVIDKVNSQMGKEVLKKIIYRI